MIVEVEAYMGPEDDGAHSFGGRRTVRTEAMFAPGGTAYIFRIYGMHCCFNVVTAEAGQPQAVLIRALEPVVGLDRMQLRRGLEDPRQLCNGPGKLCQALGITKDQYGLDLCGEELYLEDYRDILPDEIALSPRINIDYAERYKDKLWRYYLRDNPCVSPVPKRYREQGRFEES